MWSSQVTITNVKVSLTKGDPIRALRSWGTFPRTPRFRRFPLHEDHRGPTPPSSCLFVYLASHMCVCCRPLCVGLPFPCMCVSHWNNRLADSSSCSPLLLSKPFVSVRCFCFDAFFLPLHLNFHPAQSGRRFSVSIGARVSESAQHYYINSSALLFFLSHAGLHWKTPILHGFFFHPLLYFLLTFLTSFHLKPFFFPFAPFLIPMPLLFSLFVFCVAKEKE